MVRTFLLAALVASALACSSKTDQPAANTPTEPPGAPVEAQPAAAPARRVDPAAVQALLDAWLKAQNEQDFAAYEPLYASRFEGVRRTGARVARLDRAGWIADRKRMFGKRMVVELRDVEIDPFATGAAVRFTQRWASGKYEDIGPKLMVIVREGDALRIAREEMLSSQIVAATAKATGLADASFAFVIEAAGSYVVLDTTALKPATLELVSDAEPVIIMGEMPPAELPAEVASWHGERVTDGKCVARVADFAVIGRSYPHFGTRQQWDGTFDEGAQPYTEQQIAEDAYESSETVIAGRLETEGGCSMGAYVYKHGRPGFVAAEPVQNDALAAAAIRAFRGLRSWKAIQKEFVEYEQASAAEAGEAAAGGEEPGPWDQDGPTVSAWKHPKTGKILVAVQAREGVGCGHFFGRLSALFEVKGAPDRPELKLLAEPEIDTVVDALDVEGDGSLELVFTLGYGTTGLATEDGSPLRTLTIPFLDCPC